MRMSSSGMRAAARSASFGLTTHLSTIRSFEKLTGEGVTVAGAHLLQVVEELFRPRFGGSSIDYQLVEQEDDRSLPRIVLRIHPRVGAVDEWALGARPYWASCVRGTWSTRTSR